MPTNDPNQPMPQETENPALKAIQEKNMNRWLWIAIILAIAGTVAVLLI